MGAVAILVATCLVGQSSTEVASAVERLGLDSIQERESATALLRNLGEAALPDLERALESSDSEVTLRARALINSIAPHHAQVLRVMAHLFAHACESFRASRYEKCVFLCDQILRVDSEYAPALKLKVAAEKVRQDKGANIEAILARVNEWRINISEEHCLLPDLGTIRYPSHSAWPEIARSVRHFGAFSAAREDDDVLCMRRKLDTMRIDLEYANAKWNDIITFVREYSGLNIVVDPSIGADMSKLMTLKARDLVIKDALNLLVRDLGLAYVLTEERAVLLTDPKYICTAEDTP